MENQETAVAPIPASAETQPKPDNSDSAPGTRPENQPAAPPPQPFPVFLGDLQKLTALQLVDRANTLGLRVSPTRSRHQLVLELVRALLGRKGTVRAEGILELTENAGHLRWPQFSFAPLPEDVLVPMQLIRRFGLRAGQRLMATIRLPRDRERTIAVDQIEEIEGQPAAEWKEPKLFDALTATFPNQRIILENAKLASATARSIDLIAPLGRGQRGLIVAPPRVGKTIMLKHIAKSIRANYPEIHLILLLVDERPEEVTDFRRELDCDVFSSTFDENPQRHVQVAEIVSERAKRLVEMKKHVVILLDSITRLARGYNSLQPGHGRIMSGGVESKALLKPKRFFSAARNVEEGGSLTILATALIETNSKMDDVIFEEFKGTGNMEIYLDRSLVEKRVYPAIHLLKSGTRRDDLLYHPDEFHRIVLIRKKMAQLPPIEAMEEILGLVRVTRTNAELLLTGLR